MWRKPGTALEDSAVLLSSSTHGQATCPTLSHTKRAGAAMGMRLAGLWLPWQGAAMGTGCMTLHGGAQTADPAASPTMHTALACTRVPCCEVCKAAT